MVYIHIHTLYSYTFCMIYRHSDITLIIHMHTDISYHLLFTLKSNKIDVKQTFYILYNYYQINWSEQLSILKYVYILNVV